MINPMEVIGFPEETEITFSETEMEAAQQLVQLSEDDTLSCSSGTGWSATDCGGREGGGNTKIDEDVVNSEIHDTVGKEQNDGVRTMKKNVTDGQSFVKAMTATSTIRRNKKRKFRSVASIYKATKEMTTD